MFTFCSYMNQSSTLVQQDFSNCSYQGGEALANKKTTMEAIKSLLTISCRKIFHCAVMYFSLCSSFLNHSINYHLAIVSLNEESVFVLLYYKVMLKFKKTHCVLVLKGNVFQAILIFMLAPTLHFLSGSVLNWTRCPCPCGRLFLCNLNNR